SNCGACDVCSGDLDEVAEPLVVAQKVLSCVVRVGQRYGGDYVSLVLKGSKDQRITQNQHDQLSTYGLLAEHEKRAIRDWVEQLVSQGHLHKVGEYNVLQLTETGRSVLRGEITPRLLKPMDRRRKSSKATADSWEGVDRGLFDALRDLRREHAVAASVPAYVIFSDAALRDMARRRPSTLEGFRQVRGVGEKKTNDYGEAFVATIVAISQREGLAVDVVAPIADPDEVPRQKSRSSGKRPRRRAAEEAFQYFEDGHTVEQVARKLSRAPNTVRGYLQKYIVARQITDPTPWVDAGVAAKITAVIHDLGGESAQANPLKAIYSRLDGEVSYDDIRVVVHCQGNV
ncbi:MAG: RQC domain-containing protein, partial [Planctomycetota bacterium]